MAQGPMAEKWQSWDLNSGTSTGVHAIKHYPTCATGSSQKTVGQEEAQALLSHTMLGT